MARDGLGREGGASRLDAKVAIVAGAASGMGRAIAHRFAAEGAAVWVADLEATGAESVASEIQAYGGVAQPVVVDVTDVESVASLVTQVTARVHRIDVLVNAVGIADFVAFEASTAEAWERVLRVCLTGTAWTCRAVGARMIEQGGGSIVNISSTAGLFGVPGMAAYTAAKHGVVGLTKALATEWGRYGVRVNCICPGATLTPMLMGTTSEYRAERIRRVPLGRLAEADDQARVALFLASDESSYMTGSVLTVDGGVAAVAPGSSDRSISG